MVEIRNEIPNGRLYVHRVHQLALGRCGKVDLVELLDVQIGKDLYGKRRDEEVSVFKERLLQGVYRRLRF